MVISRTIRLGRLVGRRFLLVLLGFAVPLAGIEVVTLLIMQAFLLMVFRMTREDQQTAAVPVHGVMSRLMAAPGGHPGWFALAIVVFLAARMVAVGRINFALQRRVMITQARIADSLFAVYLGQPFDEQRHADRSEQRQTMTMAMATFAHQLFLPATQLLVDCLVMLPIVALLWLREPLAALAVSVWLAGFFGLQAAIGAGPLRRSGKMRWDAFNQMRRIVDGALGDVRAIKMNASETALQRLFQTVSRQHAMAIAEEASLAHTPVHIRELALVSSIVVLVGTLLLQGRSANALAAGLAIFAAASIRLLPALQRTVGIVQKLHANAPDIDKLLADRALPVEHLPERPDGERAPMFRRAIELIAVDLTFPGEAAPLLTGVSLTIGHGDRIAFAGASGAGKSSLLLLICGLNAPSAGTILVDGAATDLLALVRRSQVALVPQDPFFFAGTVRENLAFPRSAEAIDTRAAQALIDALALPLRIDADDKTLVQHLSGGERQRLAIARAILANPELLILDEATSQLDAASEARVFAAIDARCPDATLIVVSHRPLPEALGAKLYRVFKGTVTAISPTRDARTGEVLRP
jgi:ABC-type multidrug transport system fused ATPase/permease subunit